MATVLERYAGNGNVEFLSGDTPKEDRRRVVDRYKAGDIQHLCNCGLFLEGFDAPLTSAIVMARPTKSIGLYIQILGRGTRPLPGIVDSIDLGVGRKERIAMSDKPDCLVVDYCGNAGKHKIVQAVDVLSGKYEPEVKDYARSTMEEEQGVPVDLGEALKLAEIEMKLEKQEAARRAAIKADAIYATQEVSPFVGQRNGKQSKSQKTFEPCSHKQAAYIVRLDREKGGNYWTYEKAEGLSKRQASGVIQKMLAS
jgi:superfamily II DNA or RNA helicase